MDILREHQLEKPPISAFGQQHGATPGVSVESQKKLIEQGAGSRQTPSGY